MFGAKKFLVQKNWGQKSKKIWLQKNFGPKNIWAKKSFVWKNVGPQKLRPQKIGPKSLVKILAELCQAQDKIKLFYLGAFCLILFGRFCWFGLVG